MRSRAPNRAALSAVHAVKTANFVPSVRRAARSALAWTACAFALGAAGTALAAEVSGKLILASYRPEPPPNTREAFQWEIENGVKEVLPDRVDAPRELAVVIVGEGEPRVADRVEVAFSGGGLLPSTLVVRVGTTVLFHNEDEIAHELYAEGLEGFVAEATSPRGKRSVNLKTTGAWPLRDRLIPHARGHLHVLPDLIAIAQPKADGQYVFSDVTPGKYTLKVLHGGIEIASKPIEVGDKALTVEPLALTAPNTEAAR